jgi:hypothetical protein
VSQSITTPVCGEIKGDDMRMIVVGAVVLAALAALAASGSSAYAWRRGWYPWWCVAIYRGL